jgi:hypothetical protein
LNYCVFYNVKIVTCDLFAYILLVWFYVVRWFVPVATHGHLTSII